MLKAWKSPGSKRDMGQNTPYLCIAKRVTGHGVYSNPAGCRHILLFAIVCNPTIYYNNLHILYICSLQGILSA